MTRRLSAALTLALAAALVAPGMASAQRRVEAPRESVELVIAADPSQGNAAESVARDLLMPVPVSLGVRRVSGVEPDVIVAPRAEPPRDGPIAHVWLALTQRDTATLYLVDRRWERVLVRHFERTGRGQAVVLEALCHALVTAIEALLAGGQIGVSREEYVASLQSPPPPPPPAPPPPPQPPAPPLPPRPALWVDADVGYEVQAYGDAVPWLHGPRIAVAVGGRPGATLRVGGAISAQLRNTATLESPAVVLNLDVVGVRAMAVLDWRFAAQGSLRAAAGVGVDVVRDTPFARSAAYVTEAPATTAAPVARASVALRWRIAGAVTVALHGGVDVDLAPQRYVVARGGDAEVLLLPWGARPFVALTAGASWGE